MESVIRVFEGRTGSETSRARMAQSLSELESVGLIAATWESQGDQRKLVCVRAVSDPTHDPRQNVSGVRFTRDKTSRDPRQNVPGTRDKTSRVFNSSEKYRELPEKGGSAPAASELTLTGSLSAPPRAHPGLLAAVTRSILPSSAPMTAADEAQRKLELRRQVAELDQAQRQIPLPLNGGCDE